ncbi:Hachiman antiphage defense system protein HamA [Salinisphaera sp. Q1T1-3]|uniref:Hachiman antiphage defense system protein HamA n=1 Tax=Salinisphaera sp. Q1T1-3 TaxID=2321229 RepID=UPI000E71ECB7|nr:Hachiman antiphage defense system protein HamA [Salinisphaera sp. Q1T1-3]RJS94620.1 DUF1837 domain-containing protein [Salinisphaera sp. Q1T1-3]
MLLFPEWSVEEDQDVGANNIRLLTVADPKLDKACERAAAVVPEHYTSPEHFARVFENLGKPGVAGLLRTKLPTEKTKQSGDLGEILATEYIDERTGFSTPIKRLRWKDHREMSMRGDDVIGIRLLPGDERIGFLKVEAKSAAALGARTIENAREALDGDSGLPSSHTLTFLSERLLELGKEDLADAIDMAQLRDGISAAQVTQMIFSFSGNDPEGFLKTDLESYGGQVSQLSVGLRIIQHQAFIASVYEKVLNGDES